MDKKLIISFVLSLILIVLVLIDPKSESYGDLIFYYVFAMAGFVFAILSYKSSKLDKKQKVWSIIALVLSILIILFPIAVVILAVSPWGRGLIA